MSEKTQFWILLSLLIVSLGLVWYALTHLGHITITR